MELCRLFIDKRYGLHPPLGREFTRALIVGAVKVQEDLHEQRHTGGAKRASIIGGRGEMGRWFAHCLYARSHQVTIYDTAGCLRGLRISSFHPLFGPNVHLLSDRILLLAPTGHREADREIADLFTGTSLEIQCVPVEDHDKVMDLVLGLSHAINIVFREALARSGMTGKDLDCVAPTTCSKQVKTASEAMMRRGRELFEG